MTRPAKLAEYAGFTEKEVFIPNKEIAEAFADAVNGDKWEDVAIK